MIYLTVLEAAFRYTTNEPYSRENEYGEVREVSMTYTKNLPNTKDIAWLSKLMTSYPTTRSEIVRMARRWNLPETVIAFMRQFPADAIFDSRADLVSRCEGLALLIRQEWESPKEVVQSTQD